MMLHEVAVGDRVQLDTGEVMTIVARCPPPSREFYLSDKLGDEATLDTAVDIQPVGRFQRIIR